jgi:hypothetical protein
MTCDDCYREAIATGLAYETFLEAHEQIFSAMIAAEADLAKALEWRDQRAGRLHVVRRRYAYARALRVALARASRAVDAGTLYEHAADVTVAAGVAYARALAQHRSHRTGPPAAEIEW